VSKEELGQKERLVFRAALDCKERREIEEAKAHVVALACLVRSEVLDPKE
jgi:hypothetical protein